LGIPCVRREALRGELGAQSPPAAFCEWIVPANVETGRLRQPDGEFTSRDWKLAPEHLGRDIKEPGGRSGPDRILVVDAPDVDEMDRIAGRDRKIEGPEQNRYRLAAGHLP
jgi:hypothetical protein